jgi:6-phosphogluconolactonase (cycloisomerase 2 family)
MQLRAASPLTRLPAVAALAVLAFLATAGPVAAGGGGTAAVYALTNAAAANSVAVFDRAADGALTPAGTVPTGGRGTGGGLGSQGALVLEQGRLFAVNAGSDSVSALAVRGGRLELLDVAPSGGSMPVSVTAHGRLVYVVNAGAPAGISGFRLTGRGLVPIPGSSRPLSTASPGPAQIEFTPDGRRLVVTEKATNRIVVYDVLDRGVAGPPQVSPSAGQTPFGFAFDPRGHAIVSEAYGGAPDASVLSSYAIGASAVALDPNVATTETAACWVVVTRDGRYAYTTNTGSGSVSGFAVGRDGSLELLDADGRTGVTGPGSSPTDAALTKNGRFLYVLNSGTHTIAGFAVGRDGALAGVGSTGGLPAGAVGLVAAWQLGPHGRAAASRRRGHGARFRGRSRRARSSRRPRAGRRSAGSPRAAARAGARCSRPARGRRPPSRPRRRLSRRRRGR